MTDLHLSIGGFSLADTNNTSQFLQSVESLARSCGLFLRKTVIGDKGDSRTRLLDDDTCKSIGLRFSRLRRTEEAGESFEIVVLDIQGGYMRLVPVDEVAKSHGGPWHVPFGPQRFTVSIEWPLPGTLGWTGKPSESNPWQVREPLNNVAQVTYNSSWGFSETLEPHMGCLRCTRGSARGPQVTSAGAW